MLIQRIMILASRTALGGLFAVILPRFYVLQWLQGVASLGLYGFGLLSKQDVSILVLHDACPCDCEFRGFEWHAIAPKLCSNE